MTRAHIVALSLLASTGAFAQAAPDRSAPPKPGRARPFTIQQPQELKLKNGLRVLLLERQRAPLVDVVATVRAGIVADPKELPGVAGWTASMLTEGAGDLDAIAFSDAVGALGSRVHADAEPEHASVSMHSTSARFAESMKLFALALTQPRFDDKDWQRVRQSTFGYFMYQSQEPQELAGLAGARANWGPDHRLGKNLGGTPKALLQTTPADLRAFHAARYRPDTTTLVVVGDVDRKKALAVLEEVFGSWSAAGAAPAPPTLAGPVPVTETHVVTVHVPSAAQTVLRVQAPAPADIQPYTADVEVMNTLLGGSFTSRLNSNLREAHGYSYGAGSRVALFSFGNVFLVRTSVATPVTAPATKEIFFELQRTKQEAPTAEEAERARNLAALSVPSAFDNGEGTAGVWADIVARGTERARVQRFMADALKVDAPALAATAARVLADQWTLVAVGDMEAVGKDLESFGPRTTLTIDDLMPGLAEAMAALQPAPPGT
jgi:zinc protease